MKRTLDGAEGRPVSGVADTALPGTDEHPIGGGSGGGSMTGHLLGAASGQWPRTYRARYHIKAVAVFQREKHGLAGPATCRFDH